VLTLKKAGTTGGTQQSQQQGENVMTQVKISEETLKALGATAGDVEDKIKALIAANAKAQTDLDAAQASASEFTVKIEAIEGRLKAVEARKLEVSAEDRTAIVAAATAEAKKAASSEVSAAIAKVGVNAVSAGCRRERNRRREQGGRDQSVHKKQPERIPGMAQTGRGNAVTKQIYVHTIRFRFRYFRQHGRGAREKHPRKSQFQRTSPRFWRCE
jgi:hypothetical protein